MTYKGSCSLFTGKHIYTCDRTFATPGGFVPEMRELARQFAALTIHAPVVRTESLNGMDVFPDSINICPLAAARCYLHHWWAMAVNCARIWRRLRDAQAVICYAPSIHPVGGTAAIIARLCGVPALLCLRGSLVRTLQESRNLPRWKRSVLLVEHSNLQRLMFALYSRQPVFVASQSDAAMAREAGLALARGFHPLLQPLPSAADASAERQRGRMLFVGRIEAAKGVYELIEAASQVAGTRQPVHLTFVGRACDGGEAQRRAHKAAAPQTGLIFEFCGPIPYGPQLFQRYREADIFILPSFSEGFPKVLAEAMCCGCLVIGTDVGGASEIVRPGENGLLVPARDTDALAKAMRQLLTDDVLRAKLRAGAERSAKGFRSARAFEEIARTAAELAGLKPTDIDRRPTST